MYASGENQTRVDDLLFFREKEKVRIRQSFCSPSGFFRVPQEESSSCGARSSPNLLSACVRRRMPSEENLQDLYKRLPPTDFAPYPRWSGYHGHCHAADAFPAHHCHGYPQQPTDLAASPSSACRRSPTARRHKCWPPEDEVGT